MGTCLLSNYLLFRMRYVRYVMAFWWMFFISFLVMGFERFIWCSLFMYGSCYSNCDSYEGILFLPIVLQSTY